MKKAIVLVLAVFVAGVMFLLGSSAALAKAAPDEALVGVNTADASIYGLAGEKPLYLNFWATWCPPCVGEMPAIEAMYQKYGDRLHFAAVSVDNNASDAKAMIESRGLTVPVYTGDLQKMAIDYQLDAIPRSLIIGTDGKILADHCGGMSEAELEAFLAQVF